MTHPIADTALDAIFRDARTRNGWTGQSVPETLVAAVYDLTKMGPTSANCSPARFMFLHSEAAKRRLEPHLAEGNRAKTMAAPWVAIIAMDLKFAEKMPRLFPHNPSAQHWFDGEALTHETAFRNGTLQGAYLMIAARALGLDCGPMSGFDKAGVDQEFFAGDPEMASWRSNFLCNLGHGDETSLFPRSPRLNFEEACRVL